jgi:glycerol-3-phosphate dehydrogenase
MHRQRGAGGTYSSGGVSLYKHRQTFSASPAGLPVGACHASFMTTGRATTMRPAAPPASENSVRAPPAVDLEGSLPDSASTVSDTADVYDLVVIGGGITGAGVARDAALRGLRVALFEKGDYGSGTSSKSSKLIHGGLRYLEHGELGLVFESVSERAVQCRVAPHLVRPLPFLVPVYEGSRHGLETLNIGLWIYDTLAMFRVPRLHRRLRGARALAVEPALRPDGLRGAIEYYDCCTDDARLVLENVLDAQVAGALCRSYTEVVALRRGPDDRVAGVRVRDLFTGEEADIASRMVIMAAGAWTDEAAGKLALGGQRLLRRTKGVHVVFPADDIDLHHAITMTSPIDGRVMFAVPWRNRIYLGTTDTDFEGTADEVHADAADVHYLCESARHYFPTADFRPERVIATWAGLRPLIYDDGAKDESSVSREHEVFVRDDGVVIIAGGKLTTYRLMAKQVVTRALAWLGRHEKAALDGRPIRKPPTKKRALPGAVGLDRPGWPALEALAGELAASHALAPELATHLASIYGVRARALVERMAARPELAERMQPDLPYVWAEVEFAVTHDLARTLDDVLSRRVPLLLTGRDQGLDVVERVADLAGAHLGWSPERRGRELDAYRAVVADTRRFRQTAG